MLRLNDLMNLLSFLPPKSLIPRVRSETKKLIPAIKTYHPQLKNKPVYDIIHLLGVYHKLNKEPSESLGLSQQL